jgi:hypothetical protein
MKDSDRRLFIIFLKELRAETTDPLHIRILDSAILGDGDFLISMEDELGKYTLELLNAEN